MAEQTFGGRWTKDKLTRLEKYLVAYRNLFKGNPQARFFRTWYVDAFAGTGSHQVPDPARHELSLYLYDEPEPATQLDGSARIALGLESPFDHYLFIEKSRQKVSQLRTSIQTDFPELSPRCELKEGDANLSLQNWCRERDWRKERAVVFLDPFGMQVEWKTVAALGETKGVDLWYLFPLSAVVRMLTSDGVIDETWQSRLDATLGTEDWRTKFYEVRKSPMFPEFEDLNKVAGETQIASFIHERLRAYFAQVANGLVLRNSKASPLYLLCFASANQKGAPTAVKIAQQILGSAI